MTLLPGDSGTSPDIATARGRLDSQTKQEGGDTKHQVALAGRDMALESPYADILLGVDSPIVEKWAEAEVM